MSKQVRLISVDGTPPHFSKEQFSALVSETGRPDLTGDWFTKTIGDPGPQPTIGGRVSLDLADYLDAFGPTEIDSRVAAFKEQLPHAGDTETVRELVKAVLLPMGWSSVVRAFSGARIPAWSTYLFRVRAGLTGPGDIKTVGDVWTPPAGASPGRVNRRGERILYTAAARPDVAAQETGSLPGDIVSLSCFTIISDLNLINLDNLDPRWSLNTSQHRKWAKLANFYRWAFRHSGTDPDSPSHTLPQILTLDYHMLIPPLDGCGYQSVKVPRPGATNVALADDHAATKLRLFWTTVWQVGPSSSMHLASLVPARPGLSRDNPLIPGTAIWPATPN